MMKDFPMIDGEPLKLVIEVRNEMGALFQISFTSGNSSSTKGLNGPSASVHK
jgi:hypothetical protein